MRRFSTTTLIGAAGIGLAVAWAAWLGRPDFPLDDAYIVRHSIEELRLGVETRFAGSTPLQGATSPATLLPIFLLSFVMPAAWAQVAVMAAAAVLYLVGVFRLGLDAGTGPAWAVALAALAVIAGRTLFQLLNGLETGLAMAAVAWCLVWFREAEPRRTWHCLLLGALPFIRPELGVISVALLVRMVVARRRRTLLPSLVKAVAWAAAGALPPILFLLANHGTLFPNTVAAKTYFFAEGCRPLGARLRMVKLAGGHFLQAVDLAFLGFVALPLARTRWPALAFLGAFLLAYTLRLPGALFHNDMRYLYLLLPFAAAGWAAFLTRDATPERWMARALLATALGIALLHAPFEWSWYAGAVGFSRTENRGAAEWVATHVPEDDVVLVHDAGYASLVGRQPLVDLVGLKSPVSIDAHRRYTWATCGRDPRALDDIARRSGAHWLVVLDEWDRIFRLTAGLREAGWGVTRADGERGQSRYLVYRLVPPA